MRVLAWTRSGPARVECEPGVEYAALDDVLQQSDYVSLHIALAPETRHLMDERALRAMRPTAYLINTTRGEVVDEHALVRALREGWIAGAGLDVYEDEPRMAPGLAECPNTVLLPHVGSATRDTRGRMAIIAATNALAHWQRKRAPECVNPDVYATAAYQARR
jgi:glyoxylate reductase